MADMGARAGGGGGGNGGSVTVLLVILALAYAGTRYGYGGNSVLSFPVATVLIALTLVLAALVGKWGKGIGFNLDVIPVLIICVMFSFFMYFATILPTWMNSNPWFMAALLRQIMITFGSKISSAGIDIREASFGTDWMMMLSVIIPQIGILNELFGFLTSLFRQ
jgi:hypothetical protein